MATLCLLLFFILMYMHKMSHCEVVSCPQGDCSCNNKNANCNLQCLHYQGCYTNAKSVLDCNSGYPCEINCHGDSGGNGYACQSVVINSNGATSLKVNCTEYRDCLYATINCGDSANCDVYCKGYAGGTGYQCDTINLNCGTSKCSMVCQDISSDYGIIYSISNALSFQAPSLCDNAPAPFAHPTPNPTTSPTKRPTPRPTSHPTTKPTQDPNKQPTVSPTNQPTKAPTLSPTAQPAKGPTSSPTNSPTTAVPTHVPTNGPTTAVPTTDEPTTYNPTSNMPTTHIPTSNNPTSNPTTPSPTLYINTNKPTTYQPTGLQSTLIIENEDDLVMNVSVHDNRLNTTQVKNEINKLIVVYFYPLQPEIFYTMKDNTIIVDVLFENINNTTQYIVSQFQNRIQTQLNDAYGEGNVVIVYIIIKPKDITTTHFEYIQSISKKSDFYFQLMYIIFICIFSFIVIASYIDANCIRHNDFYVVSSLITASIQIMDFLADVCFSIHVNVESYNIDYIFKSSFTMIFIISIICILLPAVLSLIQLNIEIKNWRGNDSLNQWIRDNITMLFFVSAICGSAFTGIQLAYCNAFGFRQFDIPLSKAQLKAFETKRIYSTVLLENIPQLIVQIWFVILVGSETNSIVYFSILFSILSIITSIMAMQTQRRILRETHYVSIRFDVKGQIIIMNAHKCRNKIKSIRRQIAALLGLDCHIVEILRPIPTQNGLHIHMNVFISLTQAIDRNIKRTMKDAKHARTLAQIFKNGWDLNVVPLVKNVKYSTHESENRRKNTVFIKAFKAMPPSIKNNNGFDYIPLAERNVNKNAMEGNDTHTEFINDVDVSSDSDDETDTPTQGNTIDANMLSDGEVDDK